MNAAGAAIGTARRERAKAAALLLPAALWLLVFFALPAFVLLDSSFDRYADAKVSDDFTFANYARVFSESVYLKVFLRSVAVAALVTAASLLLAYPVAHFIARRAGKNRDLLFLALIVPFWTSIVIRTYAWKILLGTSGAVNYFLLQSGLAEAPVKMLFSPSAVVVGLIHVLLPFMIIPLYASLEKIDPGTVEAAMDLGAGRVQTFLRITFPLSLPGVGVGCLLVFILALGSFLTPQLLGGPGSLMISNVIQTEYMETGNWPLGGALAVVFLAVSLVFVAGCNKLFKAEE